MNWWNWFAKVIYSVGEIESKEDISHRILHLDVLPGYVHSQVRFASPYVAEQCVARFENMQRAELLSFMNASQGFAPYAAIRGQLFEGFAHRILKAGGSFDLRSLETHAVTKYTIEPLSEKTISCIDDITALKPGQYGQPLSKVFETADAIAGPNIVFQMTISTSHPIKNNGLEKIWEALQKPQTLYFVFVVPDANFETFQKQEHHNKDNKKIHSSFILPNIKQLVLKIPLTTEGSTKASPITPKPNSTLYSAFPANGTWPNVTYSTPSSDDTSWIQNYLTAVFLTFLLVQHLVSFNNNV